MGYREHAFTETVDGWIANGWLRPGDRMIEFGAQEIVADTQAARATIQRYLVDKNVTPQRIAVVLGAGMPEIAAVYEAIGIRYLSIDVDGSHGAAFFDLNTQKAPPDWVGAFDFINNEGTIEHLANPTNAFHVAHDLLKTGGIARHSFPLIGHRDHGLLYGTSKFYANLFGANGYKILSAIATVRADLTPFDCPLFRTLIDEASKPVDKPAVPNIWGTLVVRKRRGRPFVIPTDHLLVEDAEAIRNRLVDNYAALDEARRARNGNPAPPGLFERISRRIRRR
jgi:SAM-dependent methyltransferase